VTKYALLLANATIKLLFSKEFLERSRVSPTCFIRNRLMCFAKIMGVILNFSKKSSQLEVDGFMELLDSAIEKPMTKQAFSKARHKINPGAFIELFESGVDTILKANMFGRFKGRRVFAIDGTELQLPEHGDNLPAFKHNSAHSLPHARASMLCDAVSGFIVHASIATTAVGERELALEHLRHFLPHIKDDDLFLFDRGYPSKEFITFLRTNGIRHIMRVPKGFNAEVDASTERDFTVEIAGFEVRVVKLPMPKGETGIFFINLLADKIPAEEVLSFYHLRWGAETKYNSLKNKLDIESFSGRTLITVMQDFYATVLLSNIVATAKIDAGRIAAARNEGKELKYEEYAVNENLLIGRFRNNLIKIFFEKDGRVRALLFEKLLDIISRRTIPIIPGRSFPRRPDSHKRIANRQRKAL